MRAAASMDELAERFWAKTAWSGECLEWIGARSRGYGMFWLPARWSPIDNGNRGVMHQAHRVAYWLSGNPWPKGLDVCHGCDNPPCVRPEHLWAGSHQANMRDAQAKGRISRVGAPAGEASPLHRLKDDDVRAIYARANAGERQASIATDFGVTASMVSHIKRGAKRASAIRPPCIYCGDYECRSLSVCC